jgi:putative redox protein
MKVITSWKSKLLLESQAGNNKFSMDAKPPLSSDSAATPKELLLGAVSGCSAMDVVGYLKKHKQEWTDFEVEASAELTKGYPAIFENIELLFKINGAVNATLFVESIRLSQTKYCGVSAMIYKTCPIRWKAMVNGEIQAEGEADFGL